MNKVILVGNLCDNPDVRVTSGGKKVARFRLAVSRRFNREETDFLNCVAFGQQADFTEKYMSKGKKFGIIGRIQTGSYENNKGERVYTTDIVVEETYFMEKKDSTTETSKPLPKEEFMSIPDGIDEDLPFA